MREKSLISGEELLEDISGEQERWSYYQIEVMCGGHKGSSKTEYNRMVWSRDGHIGNIKGHSRK
jgi:hypothetical protein